MLKYCLVFRAGFKNSSIRRWIKYGLWLSISLFIYRFQFCNNTWLPSPWLWVTLTAKQLHAWCNKSMRGTTLMSHVLIISQTSSLKSVLAGVTNSGSLGSVHLSIEVHLKPSWTKVFIPNSTFQASVLQNYQTKRGLCSQVASQLKLSVHTWVCTLHLVARRQNASSCWQD